MPRKRSSGARLSGVLAIATLLAVAASGLSVMHAAQKKKTARKMQSVASAPAPRQATPKLSAMLQRDVEDLEVVTLPDGTQMVDLDGGFQNVAIATFDADGQLVLTCVDDLTTAETLLQSRAVSRSTRGKVHKTGKESGRKLAPAIAPVTLEEK